MSRLWLNLCGSGAFGGSGVGLPAAVESVVRGALRVQRRSLHLHEYQSMQLLQQYGIPTPRFAAARSSDEVRIAASRIQNQQQEAASAEVVVKAQVLAGGRGLGFFKENGFKGGVHVCPSTEAAAETASKMIGFNLVTKQSGAEGKPCNVVLVCEKLNVLKEMYLAILLDRVSGGPVVIGSAKGGTSIEELAAKSPDAIVKMPISPSTGIIDPKAFGDFSCQMGIAGNAELKQQLLNVLQALLRLFKEKDCLLLEINPLVKTAEAGVDRLVCADCKVNIDDNSRFRQKEVFALRDSSQENENETAAEALDLNYIKLDGNIACMVNGAGLAMATMDLIKLKGGSPANFLDVGGGAHEEQILGALRIIQRDADAKCLLINIFGGIMKCDIIAKGLVKALKELQFRRPIVVRLEGTNKDAASELLDKELTNQRLPCGTPQVTFCRGFDEAADAAVRLANAQP